MSLQVNVKRLREGRVLTQIGLAEKAGVAVSTIALIETGISKARPSTIRKLALALGVTPEELRK